MHCVDTLRESGHRLTPQRMMILDAINSREGHISAEEIYEVVHASYPQVNISTVYRTLELLEELGLATKIDLGEGRVRYHAAERGKHHHLICQRCGDITELEESVLNPLKRALRGKYGFKASLDHLAIFGLCPRCQRKGGALS